jgi:hypothetical protein
MITMQQIHEQVDKLPCKETHGLSKVDEKPFYE